MKMSVYFKEQQHYKQEQLKEQLSELLPPFYEDLNDQEHSKEKFIKCIIDKLRNYGIFKVSKDNDQNNDLSDLNIIEYDDLESEEKHGKSEHFYISNFVGVVIINGIVLKFYPKYFDNCDHKDFRQRLKQVYKVISKYKNSKKQGQNFNLYSEKNNHEHLLALYKFLLEDYYTYGLYNNPKEILENNGQGEICWNRTINETLAIISDNSPYYINLLTHKKINDQNNYFTRLHKYVLTQISNELKNADLLYFFDFDEITFLEEDDTQFGETDYILDRLNKELNIQFNTRKQHVLKAMISYFSKKSHLSDQDAFHIYGTTSFNMVWEDVCAKIFDNKLYSPIKDLIKQFSENTDQPFDELILNSKLIEFIERPIWSVVKNDPKSDSQKQVATLKPDLINIDLHKNIDPHKIIFTIIDAKYYTPTIEPNKIDGQPGVESITKQFLYHLAYRKFIQKYKDKLLVFNCFAFPTYSNSVVLKGDVRMNQLFANPYKDDFEIVPIKVRFIPASEAFEKYLNNSLYDLSKLLFGDLLDPKISNNLTNNTKLKLKEV